MRLPQNHLGLPLCLFMLFLVIAAPGLGKPLAPSKPKPKTEAQKAKEAAYIKKLLTGLRSSDAKLRQDTICKLPTYPPTLTEPFAVEVSRLLIDPDPKTKECAVRRVVYYTGHGKPGWEKFIDGLYGVIADPKVGMHEQRRASTYLARLINRSTPLHDAIQRLGTFYQSSKQSVPKQLALQALGKVWKLKSIPPFLMVALKSKDEKIVEKAIYVLRERKYKDETGEVIEHLIKALDDAKLQIMAIRALGKRRQKSRKALPKLYSLQSNPNPKLQAYYSKKRKRALKIAIRNIESENKKTRVRGGNQKKRACNIGDAGWTVASWGFWDDRVGTNKEQSRKTEEALCRLGCFAFCAIPGNKNPLSSFKRQAQKLCKKGEQEACENLHPGFRDLGLRNPDRCLLGGGVHCTVAHFDAMGFVKAKLGCKTGVKKACEVWHTALDAQVKHKRCTLDTLKGCRSAASSLYSQGRIEQGIKYDMMACQHGTSAYACSPVLKLAKNRPSHKEQIWRKIRLACGKSPSSPACYEIAKEKIKAKNSQGFELMKRLCDSKKELAYNACATVFRDLKDRNQISESKIFAKKTCVKLLKTKRRNKQTLAECIAMFMKSKS